MNQHISRSHRKDEACGLQEERRIPELVTANEATSELPSAKKTITERREENDILWRDTKRQMELACRMIRNAWG